MGKGKASGAGAAEAWGSVLQDKYVNVHAIACCPTMDLIAVLTEDRQLLVHRTISWQRIVHIKPADVYFTMETIVWSPDGMRLAVGCDEGEVVVFSMAAAGDDKGTEIKPHTGEDDLRHETAIVAMYWLQVRNSAGDAGTKPALPPSAILRNRNAAFVDGSSGASSGDASVLVTADSAGRLGFWWNGLVLVAVVPLRQHWFALQRVGDKEADSRHFTIHAVLLATDLSALLVDVSYTSESTTSDSAHQRTVLRVDLSHSLQAVQRDLGVMSRVGFEVRSIFELIRTSLRQIVSEWKNATRVFELKMSLMGSLYEKYGCEEPPQVDMLAILAGGIASPALMQYFAQDIQEMSVIRMQKLFFSGCDTIQSLASFKIKNGLQQVLFEVAELRGTVKWNHRAFSHTLGISTAELDTTIDSIGNLIATMEQFERLLLETRQDFALLFTWLLERIRIYANDGGVRPGPGQARSTEDASKSLLNSRRLAAFFNQAIRSAKEYQVKKKNKWLVEVTFGNEVSKLVNSPKLMGDVSVLDGQWGSIMANLIRALSTSVEQSELHPVELGGEIDEVRLHTRLITRRLPELDADNQPMSDDDDATPDGDDRSEFDALEAVDWESLESIRARKTEESREQTPASLIVARRGHYVTILTCIEGSPETTWRSQTLELGFLCGASELCKGTHHVSLYGGINSGKQEQLVVTDAGELESIYLLNYESPVHRPFLAHTVTDIQNPHVECLDASSGRVKRRELRLQSSSTEYGATAFAQASRGVVCVSSGRMRLVVLDAEEGPEEDSDRDEDGISPYEEGEDSDDHDEVDL